MIVERLNVETITVQHLFDFVEKLKIKYPKMDLESSFVYPTAPLNYLVVEVNMPLPYSSEYAIK